MTKYKLDAGSLLGKSATYPQCYAPEILFGIHRHQARVELAQQLKLDTPEKLPIFFGQDIWQVYELSWLNQQGKPCVACAEIRVPADSLCMIESKSLKLYLNSLNQHVFADVSALTQVICRDLSEVAQASVTVRLFDVAAGIDNKRQLQGVLLDTLDVTVVDYQPNASSLCASGARVEEHVYSHLLRSCCPVTGQPDWASISIHYKGAQIDLKGLLQYIISFRNHQAFHEQCIERIYADISLRCQPEYLLVCGMYLRRGGLDINPVRSSKEENIYLFQTARQ